VQRASQQIQPFNQGCSPKGFGTPWAHYNSYIQQRRQQQQQAQQQLS
jgi:hypothetical protein